MLERSSTGRKEAADGWISSSIIIRTNDKFLSANWMRSLSRLVDLSCSDLPGGRSWRVKLNNLGNHDDEQEIREGFLEALRFASRKLGHECQKTVVEKKSLSSAVLDALAILLDYSKPLYNYYPATRSRNAMGEYETPENEGFVEAYPVVLDEFWSATDNLKSFCDAISLITDVSNTIKAVKIQMMIKLKRALPDVQGFVGAACESLEAACSLSIVPARGLLRDAVEEITRLPEEDTFRTTGTPSAETSPAVRTWKKIAFAWFASDKLKLRRAGLEQLGEISKHLVVNCSVSKQRISAWLKSERVLDSVFVDRPEERVLPCVEELLMYIDIDRDVIGMILRRAGSKAIQKVLGNVCNQSAFSEIISARLLDGASRDLLLNDNGDAASLIKAALVDSKSTRSNLAKKGKRCVLAIIRSLVAILVILPRGEMRTAEDEHQIIEALYLVCHETDGRSFRRYAIDLLLSTLLPSENFVPEDVRMRFDDVETSLGVSAYADISEAASACLDVIPPPPPPFPSFIRADANREAAYKAIRRILSLFLTSHSGYSYNQAPYSEYSTRQDTLRLIEEEWSFQNLLFSDLETNCSSEAQLMPRLDLLAFVIRFSPKPSTLEFDKLSVIWAKAKMIQAQDAFCFWLTSACSRECCPFLDKHCMQKVLEEMFTKESLVNGGHRTFLCVQTLFLETNCAFDYLSGQQDHEEVSFVFRQAHPSADKSGSKLVGRRVSVLHSDGRMQQGLVTSYKDTWGTHSIEYYTGTIEEKSMDELNEWWLLPKVEETRAGIVAIKSVKPGGSLIGLELVWVLALESMNNGVATKAADLLVALHQRSMSEAFVDRSYKLLVEISHKLNMRQGELSDFEGSVSALDRNALRCMALLRNLDTLARSCVVKEHRMPSHGQKGKGVDVRVLVDMNRPIPVVGPTQEHAVGQTFQEFAVRTNTLVQDFLTMVTQESKYYGSSVLQVAFDPQMGDSLGGLGIPMASDEAGVDSCTLEEVGVIPGPLPSKATLGARTAPNVGGSRKRSNIVDESTMSIVPYDPDVAISRQGRRSPPPLYQPEPLNPEPSSPPPLVGANGIPLMSDRMDLERPKKQQLEKWSYPAACYDVLFSLLDPECGASFELTRAVWEFLQSVPTNVDDENDVVDLVSTITKGSVYRSLYRMRIFGLKLMNKIVETSSTEQILCGDLVDAILQQLSIDERVTILALPTISDVLLWAMQNATAHVDSKAARHCQRVAELSSCLELKADARNYHECGKERHVPPAGRLCDSCVRTRQMIRSTIEIVETLRVILISQGKSLWEAFFTSPLARSVLWSLLVSHPILAVRDAMRRMLEGIVDSPALMDALILCERKLETDGRSSAGSSHEFFTLLMQRISAPSTNQTSDIVTKKEMFSRMYSLIMDWPSASPHDNSESDILFVAFVNVLVQLIPSVAVDGHKLIEACADKFLFNTADLRVIEKAKVRASVASLVQAVANVTKQSAEVLRRVDTFLMNTPVPLRRQDKDWTYEIDWSVNVNSNDGGGLKLRKNGTMVGLVNRGSTCYANSVLQMLFSVQPFRNAILQAKVTQKKQPETTAASAVQATGHNGYESAPPPDLPPAKKKQSVAKAWQCWCSGVNDLTALQCRLCETPRPDDYEVVSESFSYAVPSELMMQIQQAEEEEELGNLAVVQRSSSSSSVTMKEDAPVEIVRQLQRAFAFLYYGRLSSFDPFKLISACKPLNLQFPVTSQNDASEFYDKLLDAVDNGLKREGNDDAITLLKNCFLGKQVKLKRCQECDNVSYSKDEEFYRLELSVKDETSTKADLGECLEAFIAPEDMFGDNKVDCDFCKTRTNTTFVTCLTSTPDFLFIHPKRFAYDLESNQTVKLNHYISFPQELDLFPYTREGIVFESPSEDSNEPPRLSTPALGGDSPTTIKEKKPYDPNDAIFYDLKGVLVHRGRAGGGHYYAFIEESTDGIKKWVQFNDDRVSAFDVARLPEECFGGKVERSTTDSWGIAKMEIIDNERNAFMLLYTKRDNRRTVTVRDDIEQQDGEDDDPLKRLPSMDQLDLSDKDMFQEQWDSAAERSMSIDEDDGHTRASPSTSPVNKSVPKPISVFPTAKSVSSLAQNALMQAQDWSNQVLRTIVGAASTEEGGGAIRHADNMAAVRKEVEEISMAATKQALLFDDVTKSLALNTLIDECTRLSREVTPQDSEYSALLLPSFRVFFAVVAKSASATPHSWDAELCASWIRVLTILMASVSFENRCAFADQYLSSWIHSSPTITSETEIGPPMSLQVALVDSLLNCPEKRVRHFYLEGVCVLLKSASQITIKALVDGLVANFNSSFKELPTQAKQRIYLEALITVLERVCSHSGGAAQTKQVVLESGALDCVLAALVTPPTKQMGSLPALETIVSACQFLASFLKSASFLDEDSLRSVERLKSPQLRNLLMDIGLNSNSVAIHTVLLLHLRLVIQEVGADNPDSGELLAFSDKLLEAIVSECSSSGTSSMSTDLPYDSTIVSNVLGEQLDQTRLKFLSKVILACSDNGDVHFKAVIERVILVAANAILTPQVIDTLQNGFLVSLPRHTVWEERLFPLDATGLRVACRLISCLVEKVNPELLKRSTQSSIRFNQMRIFQETLRNSSKWRDLKLWFMCASSPINQMCHVNGLDTDGIRRLSVLVRQGFLYPDEVEHVARLIGSTASDICLRVENAGAGFANGLYRYRLPMINDFPRWMSDTGLSIYRCTLSNGSEEWFISKLEPGTHPSDERNIDYYSSSPFPKTSRVLVPHPAEWTTLAKGRQPAPMVRKILEKDLMVLEVPEEEPSMILAPPEVAVTSFASTEDPVLMSTRGTSDSPSSFDDSFRDGYS